MKILLVYAHPNPQSFNHALFRVTHDALIEAGHDVRVHDLYAMDFDPVLAPADFEAMKAGGQRDDVAALQTDVSWAQRLFFTYPIWWYNRPAILQGYIDRVFTRGFAYKGNDEPEQGLLPQDRALVFQTTGIPQDGYQGAGNTAIHYAMNEGTLALCGIPDVRMHTFYDVVRAGDEARHQMLDKARRLVTDFAS